MHKRLSLIVGALAMVATTPALAQRRGDEPIAVPRAIKQGIDFVYVDPQMSNVARRRQRPENWLARIFSFDFSGGKRQAPNVLFAQLGQGLQRYQATYGRLPQVKVPAGAVLKRGSTGKRVELLRQRLGLPASGGYDTHFVPGRRDLSDRPRHRSGRRHRGQGDDRVAEPRLAILSAPDRHQRRAGLAPAADPPVRPLRGRRFRRRRSLSVRPRPYRRRDEGHRRIARDQDADDRGHHAQCEGQPLLARPAGAGSQPDREAHRQGGHLLPEELPLRSAVGLGSQSPSWSIPRRSTGRRSLRARRNRRCWCASSPARGIRWAR